MQRGPGRGPSKGKSKLAGADERDPKRYKSSIMFYMQRESARPQADQEAESSRESSEEPVGLPGHTPAFPLVPGLPAAPAALPTGATGGAKVQTGLLQSLQRRFVQQALQTPAVTAGKQQQQAEEEEEEEEGDEEGLGGFVLHSQPTYERCLSQRHSEQGGDVLHPSGSAEDTQTHFDLGAGPSRLGSVQGQEVVEEARQHQAPAGGVLDPEELRQQLSGASHASHHTTTPGLSSSERAAALAASGLGSTSKLFPIFRSRRDMKQLYIVRHGESEYNAESAKATSQGGKWADPWIFDAPLTERGRQQARDLRTQLAKLVLPADTLWVTSPLQRAIQTLLLCCPVAHRLRSGDCSGGVENAGPSNGAASSLPPPMVCVRQEISERVFTTGDVGHPPNILCQHFPQLAAELERLPEVWWYSRPGRVNCALEQKFELHEPSENVNARIGDFKKWLMGRPEKVIVAVGHSSYWSTFCKSQTGSKPEKMRNCELSGPIWV